MLFFEVKGGWVEVIRFVEVREGSFEFIVKKFWGIFFGFLVIFVFYLVKKKGKKKRMFYLLRYRVYIKSDYFIFNFLE